MSFVAKPALPVFESLLKPLQHPLALPVFESLLEPLQHPLALPVFKPLLETFHRPLKVKAKVMPPKERPAFADGQTYRLPFVNPGGIGARV